MDTLQVQGRVRLEDLPEDTAWPKHEVIDGSLLVTPWAGTIHQAVVGDAYFALRSAAPDSVTVYPGANVRHTRDEDSDLLIPDVVVAGTGDTVTKQAVYAEWGIPAYLVIDPVARTSTWHGDTRAVAWAKDALSTVLPAV